MDVVTVYLYGDLDIEIQIKVPEGLKIPDSNSSRPQNTLSNCFEAFTIWIEAIQTEVVYPSE